MNKNYDLIIIGAGPGGYVAALSAAKKGMKVAVCEKKVVGGTCLNEGCIPTKTMLHTAELYHSVQTGTPIGLEAEGLTVNMKQLQAHKNQVVETLSGGILSLFKKAKIDLYTGEAKVIGLGAPEEETLAASETLKTVQVGEDCLTSGKLLIATGSEPVRLPLPGMDLPGVMDSTDLLDNDIPLESLTIIGGGVIGMEFASLYASLGTKVTVIEAMDRILVSLDKEFGQNLKMILKKQRVDIHTGARVTGIRETLTDEAGESKSQLITTYEEKNEVREVASQVVLVAVGRRAVTKGLFSDTLPEEKLPAMDRGRLLVNERYETTIPGVYAIGDVTGGIQLAHAASAAAENVVAIMVGEEPPIDTSVVPSCVYTEPEIASVGLTLEEAKEKGLEAEQLRYVMSANGKTVLTRQERSFLRIVVEKGSGKIIGAQMMCARATDMIGEFAAAIVNGWTAGEMGRSIRPHPTFNEAVGEALRTFTPQ